MRTTIPYHKIHIPIEIPNENFVCTLVSDSENFKLKGTEQEIVEKAINNPIGSKSLEELVQGKRRMVISQAITLSLQRAFIVRLQGKN